VLAVVRRLNEANELPTETVVDVLTGLTLCSVDSFKKLFESYLQDVQKEYLLSTFGRISNKDTLSQVMFYLNNAAIYYRNLNMSEAWAVGDSHGRLTNMIDEAKGPSGGSGGSRGTCWNCGKPNCNVRICPEPKNEQRIAENMRKFFEEKEQNRGSRRSGGNNNNNTGSGTGGNYERSKWSPPGKGQPSIQFFDGQPHAYCSRQASHGGTCGWNTTHSTKYHGQALANPSSFDIYTVCPNNDLALAKAKMDAAGHVDAPSESPSSGTSFNKATIQERFSRLKQTISGDKARAVFEAM